MVGMRLGVLFRKPIYAVRSVREAWIHDSRNVRASATNS